MGTFYINQQHSHWCIQIPQLNAKQFLNTLILGKKYNNLWTSPFFPKPHRRPGVSIIIKSWIHFVRKPHNEYGFVSLPLYFYLFLLHMYVSFVIQYQKGFEVISSFGWWYLDHMKYPFLFHLMLSHWTWFAIIYYYTTLFFFPRAWHKFFPNFIFNFFMYYFKRCFL